MVNMFWNLWPYKEETHMNGQYQEYDSCLLLIYMNVVVVVFAHNLYSGTLWCLIVEGVRLSRGWNSPETSISMELE